MDEQKRGLSPNNSKQRRQKTTLNQIQKLEKRDCTSCRLCLEARLSWSVDEKCLKDAFSSFGEVTEVFLGGRLLIISIIIFDSQYDSQSKALRSLLQYSHFHLQIHVHYSILSSPTLQRSVQSAVEAKFYRELPDLLSSVETCQNPNPFSFLSTFHQNRQTQVVDEILLACIFESPSPLPLSFAIIKRILQSGCVPVQQTHLQLSSAWLKRRKESQSIASILLEMQSIGYDPDSGICNYLISSLCAVDQVEEAIKVVKGMGRAGCIPDSESYGIVISALCSVRRTAEAMQLLNQMVEKVRLTPRQRTILQLMSALRSNREMWKAVDMINFLEKESFLIEFESYESVVEGCIECREFVLAGKVVMQMTRRGFVPYIRVRQKVVEGLVVGIGEEKLAFAVRQRFAEICS